MNNQIREDRCKKTIHTKGESKLFPNKSGGYTKEPKEACVLAFRSPDVQLASEKRLISKDNIKDENEKPLHREHIRKISIDKSNTKGEKSRPHFKLYGKFQNVRLSDEQHEDLLNTYKEAELLIEKVSCIFENKRNLPQNVFAYIHKIGIEDKFERK